MNKMAKLLVPVAAAFFFFALCSARIPADLSGTEVALPDPEPKTLAPSKEQPESEFPALFEAKPESAEKEPLTMITFRPVDHRFRPFPLRSRRGHRCRHQRRQNHLRQLKPWGPRFPDGEVSYGNDMIVSHKEKSGFDPEFRHEVRWISASTDQVGPRFLHGDDDVEERDHKKKKHHFRHVDHEEREREDEHEDKDHDDDHHDDDEEMREHKMKKHHHRFADREERDREDNHDHDHDHEHKHFHGYKQKREDEDEHEGGFVNAVSKFLNLF